MIFLKKTFHEFKTELIFDDSYMFYRYAMNIRHGYGMSWNPDGVHTYGLTGIPWLFCILPLTFFNLSVDYILRLSSFMAGLLALLALTITLYKNTKINLVSICAIVVFPLIYFNSFFCQMFTGMETMLSLLINIIVAWSALSYIKIPSVNKTYLVGALSFCAITVRPDNGLCALGIPFLLWAGFFGLRRWKDLFGIVILPIILCILYISFCYMYFGTPVPLAFYIKSMHYYTGFMNPENPLSYLFDFLSYGGLFLVISILCFKGGQWKISFSFVIPVLITFIYLDTVRQVMGWNGRYYTPFLAYLIIPAVLGIDNLIQTRSWKTITAIAAVLLSVLGLCDVTHAVRRHMEAVRMRHVMPAPIAVPNLPIDASKPLPSIPWFVNIRQVGDKILSVLPPGSVVAASEVGYISSRNLAITIIDLAGLNNKDFALHGFSMNALLEKKPDLIWFPANDYTGQRSIIFSDKTLLKDYIIIRDAFDFGIAIRINSVNKSILEDVINKQWNVLYPGYNLKDYIVKSVSE